MSPRLPTASEFPPSLKLTVTPPPASSPQLTNILILLHGIGDTLASFTALGEQLCLPETTYISVQGPTPLPFELGGFHFGDDIQFDSASGQMELDTGFSQIIRVLKEDVIQETLIRKCGYQPREIILFGFGQGAMAAMATASSMFEELGGVISIGGPLPTLSHPSKGSKTPVLVLGGSSSTCITRTVVEKLKAAFTDVEYHKWSKIGDGMPSNREEMLPIMRFLAGRLRSRKGVPEGSLEIR